MRLGAKAREKLRARITRNIAIHPVTGCWIWKRRANNGGYGTITVRLPDYENPVTLLVHRVSYWAFKRKVPAGRHVAHSVRCVSQKCCNPDHLRATTQSCNERDKKKAERWRRRWVRELHPPVHMADQPVREAA